MVNRTVSLLATGVSGHLLTSPQEKAPKDTQRISLRQVWYLTPVIGTQKADAGGSLQVQDQLRLQRQTLLKINKKASKQTINNFSMALQKDS